MVVEEFFFKELFSIVWEPRPFISFMKTDHGLLELPKMSPPWWQVGLAGFLPCWERVSCHWWDEWDCTILWVSCLFCHSISNGDSWMGGLKFSWFTQRKLRFSLACWEYGPWDTCLVLFRWVGCHRVCVCVFVCVCVGVMVGVRGDSETPPHTH